MSQKFPVSNFEWIEDPSQFNEDFIKNYNEKSDEGYFFEVDIQYPEKWHELMIYQFYPKEKKMKSSLIENLVTNLCNKTEHVIHIKNIKQALNHDLVLKKSS